MVYGEGIYIGYRWYDAKKLDVAYPFGYGLSYTTFEYSDIRLDKESMGADDTVTVSFWVKNTGSRAGSDVAQVYVHDVESTMHRPVKELRGFKKVRLAPGEEQEISITLGRHAFEYYTPALHKWVVEGGSFEIMVGRSSREILLSALVNVESEERVKYFSPQMQVGHFTASPAFPEAMAEENETMRNFFDEKKNQLLPLARAIPFGQFADVDLGQGTMTVQQVQRIVHKMNS